MVEVCGIGLCVWRREEVAGIMMMASMMMILMVGVVAVTMMIALGRKLNTHDGF